MGVAHLSGFTTDVYAGRLDPRPPGLGAPMPSMLIPEGEGGGHFK